jgi:ADP-heptose:LPS heptosyltransferase
MILKKDCRHFPGDRPCSPHKDYGVKCDQCQYYEPVSHRILIIKLDAIGDVLRTTAILPGLREKYPASEVTWATLSQAREIFVHNPYVNRVLCVDEPETFWHFSVEHFDLVINLDASAKSSALASVVHSDEKLGFGLDRKGKVFCFNKEAETWFEMGAFDDVKKKNKRTYQELMLEICRLNTSNYEIILNLSNEELEKAKEFIDSYSINPSKLIVGINAGAGPRWANKKWTVEGYREVIQRIVQETNYSVFLYGGKYERELNALLCEVDPQRVIVVQTENSLRSFFSLLNLSDIVITGDTLALHAATALKKRVIAIFGPTSAAEIATYGRVRKVVSEEMECQCYYRTICTQETNCMNTIPATKIFSILLEEAKLIERESIIRQR